MERFGRIEKRAGHKELEGSCRSEYHSGWLCCPWGPREKVAMKH